MVFIYIAIPFLFNSSDNQYIFFLVEHLIRWPIVAATKHATVAFVLKFMQKKVISMFGAPRTVVSDSATCFTADITQHFMKI